MKFVTDLLTETNNHVFSLPRVATACAVLTLIAGAVASMFAHTIDDGWYTAFGTGVGGLLFGGTVGARFTPETPKSEDNA